MLQMLMTSLFMLPLIHAAPLEKRANSPDCEIVINAWNQMKPTEPWNAADCCYKKGVSCENDQVTFIDWNKKELSGEIHPELGKLTNLQRLYLNF